MKFHTIDDAILPALIDAFFYAAVNVRFEAEHIEYINADRKQQAAIFKNSYASIKKKTTTKPPQCFAICTIAQYAQTAGFQ